MNGDKKFRHPAGVAIRSGLDARRYRRSEAGKAEKKARDEHNEKFSSTLDTSTKREIKKRAKKSDAAKGAEMRRNDQYEYYEEFRNGGKVSLGKFKGNF